MPLMVGGEEIKVTFSVEDNASPAVDKINDKLSETGEAGREGASGITEMGDSAKIAKKKTEILGAVIGATIALIKTSYDEYTKLAESIRDLSLVNGENAENTSRFIQVLDDFQITADDATSAAKKLKDNGLSPTIETLASLSDEFRSIKDPAERIDFVYEKLGKSGAKWVNVLNQGSEALLKNADAINQNLIMNEMEIKMYEVGRLAIDKKKDAIQSFQVALGQNIGNVIAFADAMERANQIQQENTEVVGGQKKSTISYSEALNMAIAEQLQAAESSTEYKDSLKEQEEALKAVSEANKELVTSAIAITDETRKYQDAQADIQAQIADLQAEKDSYYSWDTEKIDAAQEKIDDLSAKYDENAEAFIAAMEKKFVMMAIEKIALEDGVAGYSDAEYQKAQAILQTTDVATAAAFSQAQAQTVLTDAVANGQISVEQFRDILQKAGEDGVISLEEVTAAMNAIPPNKTVTIDVITNGMIPTNLAPTATNAPVGTHRRSNAGGGTYMIPMSWGNEKFPIGSSDTASGGELISITPKGQDPNAALIAAIMSTRIDEARFARLIGEEVLRNRK